MAVGRRDVNDPTSQLRSATRRAKSDVANKLISMFLHELSRKVSQDWPTRVDSEQYEQLVRARFNNLCPYCSRDLASTASVIEHLDGLNRYRAGLHVAGNVLVACKECNGEKRRDDSKRTLTLAKSGWESFLSHDGSRCDAACATCKYWQRIWNDQQQRRLKLGENLERIRLFRREFPEFEDALSKLGGKLPDLLTKVYTDCQVFAEREITSLMAKFDETFGKHSISS